MLSASLSTCGERGNQIMSIAVLKLSRVRWIFYEEYGKFTPARSFFNPEYLEYVVLAEPGSTNQEQVITIADGRAIGHYGQG